MSRQWGKRSAPGGAITDIPDATGSTYTPLSTDLGVGTWYVVCTSTQACGWSVTSNEVKVTVRAIPVATIGSNSPICSGYNLNLTSSGGATYSWTGPGFSSSLQNPSINGVTVANSGIYSVTVTAANECEVVMTVPVTVVAQLTVTPSSNSPQCVGSTLNLFTNTGSDATYKWTGPNSFVSTDQNPSIPNVTTAAAGNYVVRNKTGLRCLRTGNHC